MVVDCVVQRRVATLHSGFWEEMNLLWKVVFEHLLLSRETAIPPWLCVILLYEIFEHVLTSREANIHPWLCMINREGLGGICIAKQLQSNCKDMRKRKILNVGIKALQMIYWKWLVFKEMLWVTSSLWDWTLMHYGKLRLIKCTESCWAWLSCISCVFGQHYQRKKGKCWPQECICKL